MKQNSAKEIFYPYDSLTETEKKRIDLYKDKNNVDYNDIHVYCFNEPIKVVEVCLKPMKITKTGHELYDISTREIQDLCVIERDIAERLAENRIYIVESHGGQYEDSWDHVEGIFTDPDKALQHAKDVCDEYDIDESKLPMTFDEYGEYNYGYPDCPDEGYDYNDSSLCEYYNTLIDRDGHTISEFEEMENAEHLKNEDFSFCTVKSYLLNTVGDDMERKSITVWKDINTHEYGIR
jgi:hypothetical protein